MIERTAGENAPTPSSGEAARSLTSRAYRELRADILSGRIPPGKKIRIKELQERFSTSLSVVREALSRLSSEDLVHAVDQRGFVASETSLEDLKDLMRTRRQIEALAIRQAVALGTPQWEAAVSAAYARLTLLEIDGEGGGLRRAEWIAALETFHETIAAGCESPSLIRVCRQLSERTQRYRHLALPIAPTREASKQHKAILQAILARDADKAAAVLDKYFAFTQELLIAAWTAETR